MAKINTEGCGHGNRIEAYAGGLVIEFNEFPVAGTAAQARLEKVKRAVAILDRLDRTMGLDGACNAYFSRLPARGSFRRMWRDDRLFIDQSPSRAAGLYGATHSRLRDIVLTCWCLDHCDHWMVGATLVHELAHVAGAPGGASHDAERAVHECGFVPQYNPTIMGSLRSLASTLERLG